MNNDLDQHRRDSDPGHPSPRHNFDRVDSNSDPGHVYFLGADESMKDVIESIRSEQKEVARSSYAETSSQSYVSIETLTPHPSTDRLEGDPNRADSPAELSNLQPSPRPRLDSSPVVDSGEHTAWQSQRSSTVDYQQVGTLSPPRPRYSFLPSQTEYVTRSSPPDIIQSGQIPTINPLTQSISEDTPLPPIPSKDPAYTLKSEDPRTSTAPSRTSTSQQRTSAAQAQHTSLYSPGDYAVSPPSLPEMELQSKDDSLPLPATARQSTKRPLPSRISAVSSSDKPEPNAPSKKDIDASTTPKLRPPLESNPSQPNTQYMNMLLALDDISQLHNMMAGFFTWILLAGFVLFPGTFTSLQEANGEGLGSAGVAILGAIQHLPL